VSSLADIQAEEESLSQKGISLDSGSMSSQLKSLLGMGAVTQKYEQSPKVQSANSGGWSSPAAAPAPASLRDIMAQESSTKGTESSPKAAPNSWAAKASTAVATGPGISASTKVSVKVAQAPPIRVLQSKPQQPGVATPKVDVVPLQAPPSKTVPQRTSDSDDFGGKGMSEETAEWCSSQLRKINGNGDLTLMQFCMTLQSAAEIREYLAAYLGSTPQVRTPYFCFALIFTVAHDE
jgi:hypothetical protein